VIESTNMWIIIFAALATYITRVGGYLIISTMRSVSPRVQAALDAVPAAVLTTIVAPAAVSHGWAEFLAIVIAGGAALRLSLIPMFIIGASAVVFLRWVGL
jgi:uncharacterized membrane protein